MMPYLALASLTAWAVKLERAVRVFRTNCFVQEGNSCTGVAIGQMNTMGKGVSPEL